MISKFGIYLETNFNYVNNELTCQDVYSKFIGLLSKKLDVNFNFLIKVNSTQDFSYYKIDNYEKIFFLKKYKNLVTLIPIYLFYLPFVLKEINQFIDELDCVIIMCPSPISKTVFKIAQRKNKKIILLFRQDIVEMTTNRYSGFKKAIAIFFAKKYQNYFYKNINKKTFVVASGEKLMNMFLPYTDNVFSIADSRFFNNQIRNINDIHDVNYNNKLRFLFVGRLEVNKGINELLSTALYYRDTINLTIVGNGPMRTEIDQFITKHNLKETITCLGFIEFGDQLLSIYRKNDFFLFPSYSEGLPQVILEAMASGCFVISTDVGSIPYIIKDKDNGILINPHNLDDIKKVIDGIIFHKFDIKNIRLNAIKSASIYSFENQINIFEKVLNE